MPDYVLTSRIYFADLGNAENALAHLQALAEHGAAHDRHVGDQVDTSWGRLHECHADALDGDTSQCQTLDKFVIQGDQDGSGDGDLEEWDGDTTYAQGAEVSRDGNGWRSLVDGNHWGPPGSAGTETVWEPI